MSAIGEIASFVPHYHIVRGYGRRGIYPRYRLGYGWGQMILRFFRPVLKRGLHGAINLASKVASDVIQGQDLKQTVKKHAVQTVRDILASPETTAAAAPAAEQPVWEVPVLVRARKRGTVARKRVKLTNVKRRGGKARKRYPTLQFM